ncbi:MAG: histidinol-phosphate aminotransferase [Planctomycetaceae bacterium]|nr:MAG: histidinol-phosphate aminotransferase [Planctomycetaceae bacterium]
MAAAALDQPAIEAVASCPTGAPEDEAWLVGAGSVALGDNLRHNRERTFVTGCKNMALVRPDVQRITGYIPGEQPQEAGWIKLNTNENPYPPSPAVREALHRAVDGPLQLYPDPLGTAFRQQAAQLWQLDPDWFLPANGSDENLTIVMRTFCDPGDLVVSLYPSYILYETLAALQGARHARLLLNSEWQWDPQQAATLVSQAKLVLVPNPNSPSGTRWSEAQLCRLIPPRGVLVLDQAYADFAEPPLGVDLVRAAEGARIVVVRTLSKSFSLAGLRCGYAIAQPALIHEMRKVKDSYNCDRLALAGGTAALADHAWMQQHAYMIRQTRARLQQALVGLGFEVAPSQANFVWAVHPHHSARSLYEHLKQRKILVRLMRFSEVPWAPDGILEGLRISIGLDEEIDALLDVLKNLL